MKPEDILTALQGEPFRPRRVHLKDGRTYDIPLRDMVVVGRSYLDIGLQAPGESPGICASIVVVDPTEVVRVEPIDVSAVRTDPRSP
jgi:hypothetical protein